MENLHIVLNGFKFASRIIKETDSILRHTIADRIYIAALHEDGFPKQECLAENIQVNRFRLSSRRLPKNIFCQLIKYFEYSFLVWLHYRKKHVKLINAHSLGALPLCIVLKCLFGAKLVYDTHELETERNCSKGLRKKLAKALERICIPFVDQIFVVSHGIAEEYSRMYAMAAPPVVLNCPKYSRPQNNNLFRKSLGISEDTVIFLYQGGLCKGRGITVIIEAFKQFNDTRKVIVFMGHGAMSGEIQKATNQYSNIYYYPSVSPDVVIDYTSSADIGISLIENSCLSYFYCMPNKLFEYTMAGLPVIVSNMPEMANFVKKHNTGVVARNETVSALIEAISEIGKKNLSQMKQNSFNAAKLYCWEEQEKIMIAAYRQFLTGGKL